ncbi:MAG: hypothetical protein FWD34_08315 [Oscillospiraceae bacterium]|nr:hypothetical protein [Oscillospiraceae bacterium]
MNDLKWITCQGLNMNPYNLSVPERVQSFGYALVFDEFGGGKTAKAQLCIHDVITAESKPNILIICPESLTQSWYSTLLSELGVDFKLISGLGNTVSFYSEDISNLYIINEEQLDSAGAGGIIGDKKFVWDLMIIDASLSVAGADWELYSKNCENKAKGLLVFASSPFPYDKDQTDEVRKMVKGFLYNDAQKELVDDLVIDESIIMFNKNVPVMRYYNTVRGKRNVVMLEYDIDKKIATPGNRIVDIQAGVPIYTYGGNFFEEYNHKLKSTYLRPYYNEDDINALRDVDTKLGVFLDKLSEVLKKTGNNIVIYFTCQNTLNYISKVITSVYPDIPVRTQTGSAVDGEFLNRFFSGEDSSDARVILATDAIGERYHALKKATHIINYEYPGNPAELERRFFRSGMESSTPEEFIMFSDYNAMFDGRILVKVMMAGLYKCFKKQIPTQNVLFWVPEAEKYLAEVLTDLKFYSENAKGAAADFAPKFRAEYNIHDAAQAKTPEKAASCAKYMLGRLVGLFDINDIMDSDDVKKPALLKATKQCVESIRDGYIYYDDEMKTRLIKNENNLDAIAREYENNKFIAGLKSSEEALTAMTKEEKYPFIRNEIEQLPDSMKTPVLYNIWKYYRFKKGIKKPLREFMDMYNKGVI